MAESMWTEIKNRVDLEDYLVTHCGVDDFVTAGADRLTACCPFHDERTPSFFCEEDRSNGAWKRWVCFGQCDASGSVIDACMRKEGFFTPMEAIEHLNDLYELGLEHNKEEYERFRRSTEITRNKIDSTRAEMASGSKAAEQARAYLHRRGMSDETIADFELAVDTSMARAGRLAIPIYDRGNHPVTVANRALFDSYPCRACKTPVKATDVASRIHKARRAEERGEPVPFDPRTCPHCGAPEERAKIIWLRSQHPKYRFEADFEKTKVLYNEPRSRKTLREKDTDAIGYFIAEGYGEVWACHEAGQRAASSYNGAVISEWQAAEAAALCVGVDKPLILIPDFDATGLSKVERNIEIIRSQNDAVEIRVIHGLDALSYARPDGTTTHPKDMGEVLQHFGVDVVKRLLSENQWSADEWLIRDIVGKMNAKTGEAYWTRERQMERVADVLRGVTHRTALHHLGAYLAEQWGIPENEVSKWLYSQLPDGEAVNSAAHIIKDIATAHAESIEYFSNVDVVAHGFRDIDQAIPGGGARRKQLAMFLGKAQPLDAKVLTPTGWATMGQMQVGSEIVDPTTGGTTHVTAVFPQGQRDVYRVTFSDGSSAECDGEHLWKVRVTDRDWQVRTLNDIREHLDLSREVVQVPMSAPVAFTGGRPLPVDPHALGALLGGGSGRCEAFAGDTLRPADGMETRERTSARMPCEDVPDVAPHGRGGRGNAASDPLGATTPGAEGIPDAYKLSPVEDRLELLRGLLEAGGARTSRRGDRVTSAPGTVEFRTASPVLADDVRFIAQSLGGLARIERGDARRRGDERLVRGRDHYRVTVSLPSEGLSQFIGADERHSRRNEPFRRMVSIEFTRTAATQCILVAGQGNLYITDDFIVTHNSGTGKTMLVTQLLSNMAKNGARAIFFSLEMPAAQVFARSTCQILDVSMDEAVEMIKHDDPRLAEVDRAFENLIIVDNVPEEGRPAIVMSPERIGQIIQEINMTRFDTPADVVAVDHLGIVRVSESAPRSVQQDDLQAAGYIMQELFSTCKMMNVYMIILQQLPKEIKEGVEFAYDAGRGGSKQTDYCDYIFCIWRPERSEEYNKPEMREEQMAVEGQYKLRLAKNRHGTSVTAHLYFDKKNLRIAPALQIIPDAEFAMGAPAVDLHEAAGPGDVPSAAEATGEAFLIDANTPEDSAPSRGERVVQATASTSSEPREGFQPPTDQKKLAQMLNLDEDAWEAPANPDLGGGGMTIS